MLNAAVVGLGHWGRRLVLAVQGKSERIRFVAAVTRTPARAAGFAREQGLALHAELAGALADPAIGAVVIASPHSMHPAHVVQAANAGKHVYVEKPLALERAGAAEAVRACASRGVVLAVGFNRRFRPAVQELQRLAREGALGTVLHLEGAFSGPALAPPGETGAWRTLRAENPGGAMTGRGIHVADLMISIAGPVASVYGFSERRVLEVDMDDTTSCIVRFRAGQTGTLSSLRSTANFWRLHVFGSKGWAEVRGERQLTTCALGGVPQTRDYGDTDTLRAALECFADATQGRARYPVTPEEAVNGAALLEALVRSASAGAPVTIEAL